MKLADLDSAVTLRDKRRKAIRARDAAMRGTIAATLTYAGNEYDLLEIVTHAPLRDALSIMFTSFIEECERNLVALGLDIERTEAS